MTIRVWDINTGECLKTLLGHTKYVWCLKVLSIEQVLSGSGDETIKLWNIISGVPLKTFKCYSGRVNLNDLITRIHI
jgi:WD40 repeat protein